MIADSAPRKTHATPNMGTQSRQTVSGNCSVSQPVTNVLARELCRRPPPASISTGDKRSERTFPPAQAPRGRVTAQHSSKVLISEPSSTNPHGRDYQSDGKPVKFILLRR